MEHKDLYEEKLKRAKKRVKEMKDFHGHVKAYIIINLLLFLLRGNLIEFISLKGEPIDISTLHWLDINYLLTPILWGIGLTIHGIYAYRHKFKFLNNWEQRQIKKYMEEDRRETKKYE